MSKKFLKKKREQAQRTAGRQHGSLGRDVSRPELSERLVERAPQPTRGAPSPQARTRRAHAGWTKLSLDELDLDGGTQSRVQFNVDALEEYAERMSEESISGLVLDQDGEPWPALTVFDDGQQKWLADGFHRMRAARRAGLTHFQADIKRGELRDAVRLSLGVNAKHGLRRTNQDKRLAITRALQDSEWVRFSDRKIAELCAVSAPTVAKLRKELEGGGEINEATERVGSDGRVQDTSTRATPRAKRTSQTTSPMRLGALALHQSEELRTCLHTTPIKASSLDTVEKKDERALVIASTTSRVDVHAVCDHLDALMGRGSGGMVIFPLPRASTDLIELLSRLERRGGETRIMALERARDVVLVHRDAPLDASSSMLHPWWVGGLDDVLKDVGLKSVYVIAPSK